jgi:hypothetical protein
MANEKEDVKPVEGQPADQTRRDFVKTSAQVAVTAPAVAVLLSGMSTPAHAISGYAASASHILDDYTFGNEEEDIDALKEHTNFNGLDGKPELDDHWTPGMAPGPADDAD